jgi:hypothetical protein
MPDFLQGLKPFYASSVRLAADKNLANDEDDGPKWVQVAAEGEYKGYNGGEDPFVFDEKIFKEVINNLHAHPTYKADENGVGTERIVPWDFEHSSTIMPSEGSLPVTGSPARAWTYDFEIRKGEDGKLQLWALTEFLPPAKDYVKNGEYQWASVSLVFDTVDPVSGKNVGAMVLSIALTNSPFIENMEKLVASRKAELERWFSKSDTPEDALSQIKDLLGLKETDAWPEVQAEIQKLNAWVAEDAIPTGINMHDIGRHLRNILNLPALMPVAEVLSAAEQSLAAILEDESATTPAALQNQQTAAGRGSQGPEGEDDMSLLKTLSNLLGTREADEAVIAEVKAAVELRRKAKEITKCAKDANDDILDAIEEVVDEADSSKKEAVSAREKLTAWAKALGVKDPDAAVNRIAELMDESAKLKELMPEVEELRQKTAEAEEQAIESDVAEAMAANKLADSLKDALVLLRKSDPEKFTQQFPKAPKKSQGQGGGLPPLPAGIFTEVATSKNGAPLDGAGGSTPVGVPNGDNIIDLSKFEGENPTARAISYVKANSDKYGVDPKNHRAVWNMAVKLKNNMVPGEQHFIDSAAEGR